MVEIVSARIPKVRTYGRAWPSTLTWFVIAVFVSMLTSLNDGVAIYQGTRNIFLPALQCFLSSVL